MIEAHEQAGMDELAAKAASGERAAMDELARVFRPFVVGLVKKQRGSWGPEDRADMEQAAWVGVVEAVHRYDRDVGRFSTFAHHRMRMHLANWIADNAGSIRLPWASWRLARRVDQYLEAHEGGTWRDLDDNILAELAEEHGATLELVKDVMTARDRSYEFQDHDAPSEVEANVEAETLELVEDLRGWPYDVRLSLAIDFCESHGLLMEVAEKIAEVSDVSLGD